MNPYVLLEDPKAVIEEPVLPPETPRTGEDAQARTDQETRDRLARDRALVENEEIRELGPRSVTRCVTKKSINGSL